MATVRTIALLATVTLAAALAGCASAPSSAPAPEEGTASRASPTNVAGRQIALDFANALVQLVERDGPPLGFPTPVAGFESVLDALGDMLAEAGYPIAAAGDERRLRPVRHAVLEIDEGAAAALRHEVSVGDVQLRRAYRDAGADRVLPASGLFVRGADARGVRMIDGALFGLPPGRDEAPADTLPPDLLAGYGYLLADPASAGLSLDPRNVFEIGRSNYAERLAPLDPVIEHVLIFDGGSDRLDRGDVALIDDVLARFDPLTDLIAITGYSTGGNDDLDANREMAMRRAERVRRALLAVGVPENRVLIEGYWSSGANVDESVPSRAATLSLRRRPA